MTRRPRSGGLSHSDASTTAATTSPDPSSSCSYWGSNDASCQQQPGLWGNGQPINPTSAAGAIAGMGWGGVGGSMIGGGGGLGGPWSENPGIQTIQPLSLQQLLGLLLPTPQQGCEFGETCNGIGELPGTMGNGLTRTFPDPKTLTPDQLKRVCRNLGILEAGEVLGSAVSLSVMVLIPPTAIVTEPVGAALATGAAAIALWRAINCD